MAISSILDGSENLTGVVKSLAAGTFIFVPAMELIPIELDSTAGKKWIKLLLLIFGYRGGGRENTFFEVLVRAQ